MSFKKLSKSEIIFLENGYATNGKWIAKTDWLFQQCKRENMQLRNRVKKLIVSAVTAKLEGRADSIPTISIHRVLNQFSPKQWKPVSIADAVPVQGYYRGRAERLETVAYDLPGGTRLDKEFFCALLWDSETVVHEKRTREPHDPVFLTRSGEIVFVVAPLRPDSVDLA